VSDARVVSQEGGDVQVDAILALAPGKVYSTSGIEWQGTAVVKTDELQKLLHLPLNQPADAVQLATDLETATKLYRTRGYMLAKITSKPVLDDDKSTVHYDFVVSEGDQFKMGELDILGLDSQATAHLQAEWKLLPGAPYNGEYPKQFLDQTAQFLPRAVPWNVSYHEAVNETDKTVDVSLHFTAR
jgi:outer membrane protein assembly factor BamA